MPQQPGIIPPHSPLLGWTAPGPPSQTCSLSCHCLVLFQCHCLVLFQWFFFIFFFLGACSSTGNKELGVLVKGRRKRGRWRINPEKKIEFCFNPLTPHGIEGGEIKNQKPKKRQIFRILGGLGFLGGGENSLWVLRFFFYITEHPFMPGSQLHPWHRAEKFLLSGIGWDCWAEELDSILAAPSRYSMIFNLKFGLKWHRKQRTFLDATYRKYT